jgi:hypothetical protein
MDIFRVDDEGRVVEHWDVLQVVPSESTNGNSMFQEQVAAHVRPLVSRQLQCDARDDRMSFDRGARGRHQREPQRRRHKHGGAKVPGRRRHTTEYGDGDEPAHEPSSNDFADRVGSEHDARDADEERHDTTCRDR